MTNLYDVARMVGVSKSTVSRVINNEPGVKEETRRKVRYAIAESDYVINQVAKDLKSSETRLIGVIVPRISSQAIYRGVEGLTREFELSGKQVLLANSELCMVKELEYIALFNQKRVEGIAIFATHIDDALINAVRTSRAPVIFVGQDGTQHGIASIIYDDYRVGYLSAEKLIGKGCTCPGYLGVHTTDIAVGQQRYLGFADATRQLLGQAPCFYQQGEFSIASGYQQMSMVITEGTKFDGVFCATDKIAVGAMQALIAGGKAPGRDIYVIGVGNDEVSTVVAPSLSTFDLPFAEAGEKAGGMLLDLIRTGKKHNCVSKITLGGDWIPRDSCPD